MAYSLSTNPNNKVKFYSNFFTPISIVPFNRTQPQNLSERITSGVSKVLRTIGEMADSFVTPWYRERIVWKPIAISHSSSEEVIWTQQKIHQDVPTQLFGATGKTVGLGLFWLIGWARLEKTNWEIWEKNINIRILRERGYSDEELAYIKPDLHYKFLLTALTIKLAYRSFVVAPFLSSLQPKPFNSIKFSPTQENIAVEEIWLWLRQSIQDIEKNNAVTPTTKAKIYEILFPRRTNTEDDAQTDSLTDCINKISHLLSTDKAGGSTIQTSRLLRGMNLPTDPLVSLIASEVLYGAWSTVVEAYDVNSQWAPTPSHFRLPLSQLDGRLPNERISITGAWTFRNLMTYDSFHVLQKVLRAKGEPIKSRIQREQLENIGLHHTLTIDFNEIIQQFELKEPNNSVHGPVNPASAQPSAPVPQTKTEQQQVPPPTGNTDQQGTQTHSDPIEGFQSIG